MVCRHDSTTTCDECGWLPDGEQALKRTTSPNEVTAEELGAMRYLHHSGADLTTDVWRTLLMALHTNGFKIVRTK